MPSPLAHSAAAYIIYRSFAQNFPRAPGRFLAIPVRLLVIIGLSLLPDVDVVPGLIAGDMARFHNNLSHSLFVGVFVALACALGVRWLFRWPARTWFGAALISYNLHIVMDFFTGERGVMLLWPLTAARFSAPVKLFMGVQWGDGLVSVAHLYTLATEALFVVLALLSFAFVRRLRPLPARPRAAPDASGRDR